ncbi:unnamed protein product [Caenorhabditis angaria]|uniref:Uncharacterized protein n=1 Tax=Caenorhabditis angaria TaxID=860376 RepID=A0A9P1IKZ4_9PELO|nr:unnamed protein product [Caenorhabditis angaria]
MILLLLLSLLKINDIKCEVFWSAPNFPDLRGPTMDKCVTLLPRNKQQLFFCDPDHILNNTQALQLNALLQEVAVGTPCHCQRRSQCTSGNEGDEKASDQEGHGFIVSIAMVENLQMPMHTPSDQQIKNRADRFCKALEGRWALGDCGNSVIVFIWRHYGKMAICPARLAEKYITLNERISILSRANKYALTQDWYSALNFIIKEISMELNGEPEPRFDTGTLSLLLSVGLAVVLTLFITCCVCAFRCCGNVRTRERRKSVERAVDNLRNSVIRRGSQFRRSISRSPKMLNPTNVFFGDATAV